MRDIERQREWFRARYHRRRAEYFDGKQCVRCGGMESLQLDHKDPALKQRRGDHGVWGWGTIRREAELAKCQPLCQPCHLAKSIEEGSISPITHGTRNRYRAGCRCAECREWNNAGVRRRRHAQRDRIAETMRQAE